jgi:hypothetical protein
MGAISCFGNGLASTTAGGRVVEVAGAIVSSDDVGRRNVPLFDNVAEALFDDVGFKDIC